MIDAEGYCSVYSTERIARHIHVSAVYAGLVQSYFILDLRSMNVSDHFCCYCCEDTESQLNLKSFYHQLVSQPLIFVSRQHIIQYQFWLWGIDWA